MADGEDYYLKTFADFQEMGLEGAAKQVLQEGLVAWPRSIKLLELAKQNDVEIRAPVSAAPWMTGDGGYHEAQPVFPAAAPLAPPVIPGWRPPPTASECLARDAGDASVKAYREAQAAHAAFVEAPAEKWAALRDALGGTEAMLAEEKRLRTAAGNAFQACKDKMRRTGLEHRIELLRPPCTPDVASRVHDNWHQKGGAKGALMSEVVRCGAKLYESEVAFEEEGPNAYLRLAHDLSELDAPPARAKELATAAADSVHALLDAVAKETEAAVKALPANTATVLVLGGHGASAVAAARAGAAKVVLCESRKFIAACASEVLRRNLSADVAAKCTVEEAASPSGGATGWDVVAVDLWDGNSSLALGAIEVLQELIKSGHKIKRTVPDRLVAEMALADGRLASVSGFDLSRMDVNFRGLACMPIPAGPPGDATSSSAHATSWRPVVLTQAATVLDVRLQDAKSGAAERRPLKIKAVKSGHASCAYVTLKFYMKPKDTKKVAIMRSAQWLAGGCAVTAGKEVSNLFTRHGVGRLWLEWDWSKSVEPPLGYMALSAWYFEMLRDGARHDLYEAALKAEIAAVREKQGGKCRVLDVGSGDGILSMMALRAGASAAVGVEVVTAIARASEQVLAANRPNATGSAPLPDETTAPMDVWCMDVRGVNPPPDDTKFDVLVSELMDASGLGENLILLTKSAKTRLCRDGTPLIPARLRLHAVLCEAKLPQVAGVNMDAFWPFWPGDRAGPNQTLWCAVDLDKGEGDFKVLSKPAQLLDVELGIADVEDIPDKSNVDFVGIAEGTANVVIWWFETPLSRTDPSIVLTNAPNCCDSRHAPTCWGQAMAPIPKSGVAVSSGSKAEMVMEIPFGDYQLKFRPRAMQNGVAASAPYQEEPPPGALPYSDAYQQSMKQYREQQKASKRRSRDANIGRTAMDRTDLEGLGALQSCATALVAQPRLFGVDPTTAQRMCMGWYAVGGEGRN
eukprot:TRINITY_DN100547_c0_g1_i1.p1 TRINITY_DN100547_c0_g1~~TRINITY_DN100547_c0_g1_i1.p1  ORF type:complete len:1000 (-),score=211.86 TRINITY_DN100547_c0_g1_i1:86-2998(-)